MGDALLMLMVLAVAGGARGWYVHSFTDDGPAPLEVQGSYPYVDGQSGKKSEVAALVESLTDKQSFAGRAPLADQEETTAHRAPGYCWIAAQAARWLDQPQMVMRWLHVVLGSLTAACYFLFARRAFQSLAVGFLAGLLVALHPFYILNTAELNDGVLATFLLAATLALGTRGGQEGGPVTSLLFGLSAAGLAMVRAALLPFATLAVLWYLLRCRKIKKGWFAALLAFLGFANGLAPWAVRNFRTFGHPVPVADSALLHLWIGNCRTGSGGPMSEAGLRKSLPEKRLQELLAESNQARRYTLLGRDLLPEIVDNPGGTLQRRLWAGLYFVFGQDWFTRNTFVEPAAARATETPPPDWLLELVPALLAGAVLAMLPLALIGWRWSYLWRRSARLAAIAVIWLPLPYLLSHADLLSGPRLPLDGVLLCYGAFTLACLVPGLRHDLARGGPGSAAKEKKDKTSGRPDALP